MDNLAQHIQILNAQNNHVYSLTKSLKGLRLYGTKSGFTQLARF